MSFVVHRVSQQAARYTPGGGREKCGACRFLVSPTACGKVIGPVSPMGWCKYFSRQMVAQFGGSQVGLVGLPGLTLSLDFMTPGSLDSRITFTRASTATYTDASGVIQTAAINAPRWDYAGGVLRGLLIEEARTNLFLNSATLVTQGVAVTAQAYTLSFYGTGTVTKSGAATGALVGTGATQRVTQTFTPTAGTVTCTVTGSVTNAQIEAGSFATSWIVTAGASVTRAGDFATIPPASMAPWFVSPGGSWLMEFDGFSSGIGNNMRVLGPASGALTPMYVNSAGNLAQFDSASAFGTVNVISANAVMKGATTWAVGTAKNCLNGGAVASSASLTTGYGGLTGLGVTLMTAPSPAAGETVNGHIRRLSYWPRALSDAEMQAVTT